MSKPTDEKKEYVGIKLDPAIKQAFVFLARQEKLNLTEAIENLIVEAISRGYIVKQRHEALAKEVGYK